MNIKDITPAQTKAIEAGGTNNAVIGGSLVKRGIFEKVELAPDGKPWGRFKFVPAAEFLKWESSLNASPHIVETIDAAEEKKFADAMRKEENETPTSEVAEIVFMKEDADRAEIEALRAEWPDADDERRAEIGNRLVQLGTVVYPAGTAEYEEYRVKLRAALAQWNGTEEVPASDAEVKFAEAVDADDVKAQKEILDSAAPLVLVKDEAHTYSNTGVFVEGNVGSVSNVFRNTKQENEHVCDPKETRYAHIARWTDENLEVKYRILHQRLGRRTLLRADRMQTERHLQAVEGEIIARGLRP